MLADGARNARQTAVCNILQTAVCVVMFVGFRDQTAVWHILQTAVCKQNVPNEYFLFWILAVVRGVFGIVPRDYFRVCDETFSSVWVVIPGFDTCVCVCCD